MIKKIILVAVSMGATFSVYAQEIVLEGVIANPSQETIIAIKDYDGDGKKEFFKVDAKHEKIFIDERVKKIFTRRWGSPVLGNIKDVAFGDVNNDEHEEMLVLTNKKLLVFLKTKRDLVVDKKMTVNVDDLKDITLPQWLQNYSEFSELSRDQKIGRALAIGDFDGDKMKEVILLKSQYATEAGLHMASYVIKWEGDHFEVIGSSIISSSGKEGLAIIDLNNDGQDELLISGYGVIYIYAFDSKKQVFGLKAWLELPKNTNVTDQQVAFGEINGVRVIIQCAKFTTSGFSEYIGKLRLYKWDPTLFSSLGELSVGTVFEKKTKEERKKIYEFSQTIELLREYSDLPVEQRNGKRYSNIQNIFFGDYDEDGHDEIICEYPNKNFIFKIYK